MNVSILLIDNNLRHMHLHQIPTSFIEVQTRVTVVGQVLILISIFKKHRLPA